MKLLLKFLFTFCLFITAHNYAQVWTTPPTTVSDGIQSTVDTEQQLAVSRNGTAAIVWFNLDTADNQNQIVYTSVLTNKVWSPPTNVDSTTAPDLFSDPSIAINDSGQAIAVWFSDLLNEVRSSSYDPGTGIWSGVFTTLPTIGSLNHLEVTLDNAGRAVAVWHNTTSNTIQSATFNGGWGAAVTLDSTNINANSIPSISMDPVTGNALAVWPEFNSGTNDGTLKGATYVGATQTWLPAVTISTITLGSFHNPEVALSRNGTGAAIWSTADIATGAETIQSSSYVGGIWLSPTTLTTIAGPSGILDIPQISLDDAGNGAAVWRRITSANVSTVEAMSYSGGAWSGTVVTLATATLPPDTLLSPQISIDPQGNGIAIWVRRNLAAGNAIIEAAEYKNGLWTASPTSPSGVEVSNITDNAVGTDLIGNIVVSWNFNSSALNGNVVQASLGSEPPPPPPPPSPTPPLPPSDLVGAVIKNRFLTQTDRIHVLIWSPSPDPSVLGYHIYRNGKLIATLAADGPFIYKDHNRSKDVTDTYIVAAFNAFGDSAGITVNLR